MREEGGLSVSWLRSVMVFGLLPENKSRPALMSAAHRPRTDGKSRSSARRRRDRGPSKFWPRELRAALLLPGPARAVLVPADSPLGRCRTSRAIRLPRNIPMDSPASMEDSPIFYVGHHETRRSHPVTELLLHQAQDLGVRQLSPKPQP